MTGLTEPVYFVDGDYRRWEDGGRQTWRGIGWQASHPSIALQQLDATVSTRPFFMAEL